MKEKFGVKMEPEEIELIVSSWLQGVSVRNIAAQIGRDPRSVRHAIYKQRQLGRDIPERIGGPRTHPAPAIPLPCNHVFYIVRNGSRIPLLRDEVFRLYGVTSRVASRGSP
jgi:hypothetical protein